MYITYLSFPQHGNGYCVRINPPASTDPVNPPLTVSTNPVNPTDGTPGDDRGNTTLGVNPNSSTSTPNVATGDGLSTASTTLDTTTRQSAEDGLGEGGGGKWGGSYCLVE